MATQVIPAETTAGGGGGGGGITADQTVAQLIAAEGSASVGDMAIPTDEPLARFVCESAGTWTVQIHGYSFPASAIATAADFSTDLDSTSGVNFTAENFSDASLGVTWTPTVSGIASRYKLQSTGGLSQDYRVRMLIAPTCPDLNYSSVSTLMWDTGANTGQVLILCEYDSNMRSFPINGDPAAYTGGTIKVFPGEEAWMRSDGALLLQWRDDGTNLIIEYSTNGGVFFQPIYSVSRFAVTHSGVGLYSSDSTNNILNSKMHVYSWEVFDDS